MISPTGRDLLLAPVRPNQLIARAYHARLDAAIEALHRSLLRWVIAAYRANEPEMAQDESPARALATTMARLRRRWLGKFDELGDDLARWFATETMKRSDSALRRLLAKAGMTVKFRMSRAMNDAYQASIVENVGLIRSIAAQHLDEVEGMVMRSVQTGRDIGYLTSALHQRFEVSKRRAALIARDQNAKATAVVTRVRQQEIGIEQCVWLHSGGGKVPRPSHVRAGRDKVRYDVKTGWFDPHEQKLIFPGELISCRCVGRAVIPGLS